MQITGKIIYVNLSGGFWGIKGDDGNDYAPVGKIPASFQEEGLRIKAQMTPDTSFSIFMWGQNVKIQNLEKIS